MKNLPRIFGRTGIIIGVIIGALSIWFYEYLIPVEVEYPELATGLKVEETLEEKQLSLTEMMPAIFAWHYFQKNTDDSTGMFSSAEGEKIIYTEDIPDYMLAVFSARKLGIITREEFDTRLDAVFGFLESAPLTENSNYFSAYSLKDTSVAENYELDLLNSFQFASIFHSIILNNEKLADRAFRILKQIDIKSRIEVYLENGEIPAIDGKVVNLYIKSMQLPDSLIVINTASDIRYPLDFTPFLDYLQMNIKYWNNEQLKIDYLNNEEAYYYRDSSFVTFDALSLGMKEKLYYYVSSDSVYSVYSKKMIEVDERFISTSGGFYRKLLSDDENADKIAATISDLYDPERGWYEGRLVRSGDIITFINARTNAAVLNVLCLSTYKSYY